MYESKADRELRRQRGNIAFALRTKLRNPKAGNARSATKQLQYEVIEGENGERVFSGRIIPSEEKEALVARLSVLTVDVWTEHEDACKEDQLFGAAESQDFVDQIGVVVVSGNEETEEWI